MTLAISNLAWNASDAAEDAAVLALLGAHGVRGLEIAPTKWWADPAAVTRADAEARRARVAAAGLEVVALQALLFGRPDLVLFGEQAARRALAAHLTGLFRLAEWLGAGALVFGSPGNRRVGALSRTQADAIATAFFREVGAAAADHGVRLCLEPNARATGCDFVTSHAEALALVSAIDSPGIAVQFDTGALIAADEAARPVLTAAAGHIGHVHVSEPGLVTVGSSGAVPHAAIAAALRCSTYTGWLSIEMVGGADARAATERVAAALRVATPYRAAGRGRHG